MQSNPHDGARHFCYHPYIDGIMYVSQQLGNAANMIEFDDKRK